MSKHAQYRQNYVPYKKEHLLINIAYVVGILVVAAFIGGILGYAMKKEVRKHHVHHP